MTKLERSFLERFVVKFINRLRKKHFMTETKTRLQSILTFSKRERFDLLVSWITLSIAFALVISPIFLNLNDLMISLPIAFLAVGTGFIFHELAHREVAKHYGFHSEFRAWYPGLVFAIILAIVTMGQFIFAAPGATYFFAQSVSRKQNGIISTAGPAINLIIGIGLLLLAAIFTDKFILTVLVYAAMINFWFALFNLLPVYPLDGAKVLAWKPIVWIILIAVAALMVLRPNLVLGAVGIKLL